eukprot:750079-Hanusia_phi.AAC.4
MGMRTGRENGQEEMWIALTSSSDCGSDASSAREHPLRFLGNRADCEIRGGGEEGRGEGGEAMKARRRRGEGRGGGNGRGRKDDLCVQGQKACEPICK